jgi:hypothetical protein
MFNKKENRPIPSFRSRAEAFDYMFAEMCDRGADLEDAAKRADAFADIIARNRTLPDAPEKEKNVIDKCVGYLNQITVIKRDYPEVWTLAAGALGGLIGAFTGGRQAMETTQDPLPPPPNFDEIQ